MKNIQPSIPYIGNLDGLRAIAVLLVLFDHWSPTKSMHDIIEFGRTGLLLFFMLSGFLITSVLLSLKTKIASGSISPRKALLNFYQRRFLRLFPVYFLALIFAVKIVQGVRPDIIFHLLFLQNLSAMFYDVQPIYGIANHLWSLGVEEQFYLLWAPAVLIFFKTKQMIRICFVAIIAALIYKLCCSIFNFSDWALRLNTLGNIDSLAIGCLLAIDRKFNILTWNSDQSLRIKSILTWSVPLILFTFIFINQISGYYDARQYPTYFVFHDSLMQVPLWLLLHYSVCSGVDNKFLCNKAVVWIGQRSYGIYVWHNFVSYGCMYYFQRKLGIILEERYSFISLIVFTIATLIIAAASWRFIELPFLRYKSKLDDGKKSAPVVII